MLGHRLEEEDEVSWVVFGREEVDEPIIPPSPQAAKYFPLYSSIPPAGFDIVLDNTESIVAI